MSAEETLKKIAELAKTSPDALGTAINAVMTEARMVAQEPLVIKLDEKNYVEIPLTGQNKVSVGLVGLGYVNVEMSEAVSRVEVMSETGLDPIHEIEITGDEFRSIGYEEEADDEESGD